MSNYTKTTNFTSKDSLSTGNPLKIVRGAEHDTEYSNIATAIQTKADLASPALTGTATAVNITVSGNLLVGSDTATTNTATQTLTNKTVALGSNTVSGTTAQFNTALTDGDFATLAGTETLTNKTISGGSVTGITDLAVADGGTGASDASTARTNLGAQATLVSGTNIKTINGSSILGSGDLTVATSTTLLKNRLINSAMVIDQRNAGASVTPTANGTYTLDRWQMGLSNASKYSVQQSSTAPTGFSNSLLVTSLAATSLSAVDYYSVSQAIEGFNTSDLGFGTANAKTVTVSFWVQSSLTGTFAGWLQNSANNRSYPFSYTISAANTWEQKTVTIAGDTSGTWIGATNGVGLYVGFSLGMGTDRTSTANSWQTGNYRSVTGAVSVVGTSGATFYITGVQLEVGSSATGFEYVNYQTSLANCQRYYESISYASGSEGIVMGFCQNATVARYAFPIVAKRATPTMAYFGTLAVEFASGSTTNVTAISSQAYGGGSVASLYFGVASGLTAGQACCLYANGTTVYITFSSEL